MPLSAGQTLENRYRIVKLLGEGGFGAVYRAWDTKLSGPCAVKESFETSAAAQKQFSREASLLFNLRHPNLPRVFDSFVIPGQGLYLVMDFIEGQDLQEMLDQAGGPLPESQVLPWIAQVCEALDYLHSQNPVVVHRDLKPANIRIGPKNQAMLVDFGIAKVYNPNLRTTAGARAVTQGYSPPEQYGIGAGSTDARSDVYSLGATLYALLSGQAPPDSVDVLTGNLPAPRPVRQLNPQVSPSVSSAIAKAMVLDRAGRWQSVAEFKAALFPTPTPSLPLQGGGGKGGTVVVPASTLPSAIPPGPVAPAPVAPTAVAPARPATPKRSLRIGWPGVVGVLIVGMLGMLALVYPLLFSRYGEIDWSATWAALPTPIVDASGAHMVLMPAGEFQMGSKIRGSDMEPVHTVYLDNYYIDVYEVTNARYAECVAAGMCDPPTDTSSYTHSNYYGNPEYANYPVIYVTWSMAQAYCQWREGSLPTEAQWEKAARGGLEGKDYPWGDEAPTCTPGAKNGANSEECNREGHLSGDPMVTGSFAPNGYGLYDMAGNVSEWVWDWYLHSFYNVSPGRNPTGPDSGRERVLRGGTWEGDVSWLGVYARSRGDPTLADDVIGFRCARSS